MSEYILASRAETERLRLQARTWEAEAAAMLDHIGIQPGWSCLDVGCGARGFWGCSAAALGRMAGSSGLIWSRRY